MRRRPAPLRRPAALDLAAFFMVLTTGVTLVALGLSPESLAAVAIALAGLYSAWHTGRPPTATPSDEEGPQEGSRTAQRGTEEGARRPGAESSQTETVT
jgi:hypothetical protein